MANPGAYKIVAKMLVKPENLEHFQILAAQLVKASAAEEGNLHYSLNVNKKNPCLMAFTECWEDKEAIRIHNATEHFQTILPQLLDLCEGEPVTEMYIEL